jgi:flagellum-specific peptidoglycan hydrolase FlgJ
MQEPVLGTEAWTDELTEDPTWQLELVSEVKRKFVNAHRAAAKTEQVRSRVPELVTLTQAALESGWGKHAPRFNFFGIKAKKSDPEDNRQLLRTVEIHSHPNAKYPEIISITKQPDGTYRYVVKDWFKAFPDAAAAFRAHGDFLVNNPRYAAAFNHVDDPYAFAEKVAEAGYATDPDYGRKLKATMRGIEELLI